MDSATFKTVCYNRICDNIQMQELNQQGTVFDAFINVNFNHKVMNVENSLQFYEATLQY